MRVSTNPNKEIVSKMRVLLKENDNYCPCRIVKTPDTKCMCKEFREQIEAGKIGECHCGLYVVTEVD